MFSLFKKVKKEIYLDFAAGTPLRDEAAQAMVRAFSLYGNPSSLHAKGLQAKDALRAARQETAQALGAHDDEIIFTGSATESDNLALRGAISLFRKENPDVIPHIVVTRIEHAGVRVLCEMLEREGVAEVTFLDVDEQGRVDKKKLHEALKPSTVLVSCIHANNEIGTLQDMVAIAKTIRHYKKHDKGNHSARYPLLHTDASQSFQYSSISMNAFPVDLMTVNSSKLYGPRGVALLYVRRGTPLMPIMYGGGQEHGLRPGTENIPAIIGFARALSLAVEERSREVARLTSLQEYAWKKMEEVFGERVRINGDREHSIPSMVNVTFKSFESELLVIELDAEGVYVSSKSACDEAGDEDSSVVSLLHPGEDARIGGLRISFGKTTVRADIDTLIDALTGIFQKYKDMPQQTIRM